MLRTKVLIVGGGPAGSTAARFLAREGIDTILAERNLSFIKPCGGGMPSTAFDELGIPKTAIKKEIRRIRIVSPKGDALEIGLKGGALAIVQRGEFDSILRDEAKKSGAQILEAGFTGLEESGKQVTARISVDGKDEYVKTDYIVAADGVNSRVRTALGLKAQSSLYTLSEKIENLDSDSCEFWFGASHAPKFYSWVFPRAAGISVGTGSLDPKALRVLLPEFYKRRGLISGGAARMYRIPLWDGELYNKNNIFFAGDAAGHVMPFTYEGMYHAMKAGEFAARAIIGEKASDYKRLWKKRFYSRFMIMKKLCDYFLRDDDSVERMIGIFGRQKIQDMCMRLWLEKSSSGRDVGSFINFFRRILSSH